MKERHRTPIIPQGITLVRSSHAVNSVDSQRTVAQETRRINTPQFITDTFFDTSKDSTLVIFKPTRETAVSVVIPSGPYTPDSVMIIAADQHILASDSPLDPIDPSETAFIYDYDFETQYIYWQTVLTTLQFFQNGTYFENAAVEYSNEQHRTPRSIGVPHGQIGTFNNLQNLIRSTDPDLKDSRLAFEEAVVMENKYRNSSLTQGLISIHTQMKRQIPKRDSKNLRWSMYGRSEANTPPFGYQFELSGRYDGETFANFMRTHHEIYESVATQLFQDHSLIHPETIVYQPTYRLYIQRDETIGDGGGLLIVVSPNIVAPAGAMDAAGHILNRAPENPVQVNHDEIKTQRDRLVHFLREGF